MARRRHTAEQIIHKLREAEVKLGQSKSVKAVCKQLEITEQGGREDALHRTRLAVGERLQRKLQRQTTR